MSRPQFILCHNTAKLARGDRTDVFLELWDDTHGKNSRYSPTSTPDSRPLTCAAWYAAIWRHTATQQKF